jgi:hypothetical protein
MKEETIKGLIEIVNELIDIRQEEHRKLQKTINEPETENLAYTRNQLRNNSERIQYLFKLRKEIEKTYQK